MILALLAHLVFILTSLTLLVYAIWYKGRKRKILAIIFLVVFGSYLSSILKDFYDNSKIEKNYAGKYVLTSYKDCKTCILELYSNNSYKIYSGKNEYEYEYETGNWEYSDDGDHSFIKFNNGGELGLNEYQFVE